MKTTSAARPIRRRKVYPDRASALQRFRLTPTQECENRFIVDYIAERSITQIDSEGAARRRQGRRRR